MRVEQHAHGALTRLLGDEMKEIGGVVRQPPIDHQVTVGLGENDHIGARPGDLSRFSDSLVAAIVEGLPCPKAARGSASPMAPPAPVVRNSRLFNAETMRVVYARSNGARSAPLSLIYLSGGVCSLAGREGGLKLRCAGSWLVYSSP